MTKRICAMLCLLALLFTSCTVVSEAPSAEPAGESPSTQAPGPGAAAESEGRPEALPNPEKSVTAGGFVVHTDPSGYSPYAPPVALYTRPEGVDLQDFHPENAHGAVYPYVSERLYTSSPEGYTWGESQHYGFVDETGTLVTEGVYTNISAMQIYDYVNPTREYLPLWVVTRVGDVRMEHVEYDGTSYDYPEATTFYGVVAMDGSFSLPCEYVSIRPMEDRLICMRSWEASDCVVYDFQGHLLLTGDRFSDQTCDSFDLSYREGYYTVRYYWYTEDGGDCQAWYADESGQRVLGPYREANDFYDGLAMVSEDGSTYGFIDRTGNWVIPPQFLQCNDFYQGYTCGRLQNGDAVAMDSRGNVLVREGDDGYFSNAPCGFVYSDSDGESSRFYDRTGNLLFSGRGYWVCEDENTLSLWQEEGLTLHSISEDRDVFLPDMSYVTEDAAMVEGSLIKGYRCSDYETDYEVFVTRDLSRTVELREDPVPDAPGRAAFFKIQDQKTGAFYYAWYHDRCWNILSAEGELLGTTRESYPGILGGMLFSWSGLACTYQSLDGTLIFSFPLQGGAD